MPFSISFTEEPVWYPGEGAAGELFGLIVLDDFMENFSSSLFEWSKQQYLEQWQQALSTIVGGATKAALITSYVGPQNASHLVWWSLYRVNQLVYVQNHLLFYDQLTRPFAIEDAVSFLHDRQTVGEDGEQISEWCVRLSDIRSSLE